ncbi:MAG: hypothetical protein ACXWDL_11870 [Nocardioides sp.]
MAAIEILVLFGVVITLVALVFSRFGSRRRHDDVDKRPIRPNPIFWFIGSITALAGVVMLVAGAQAVAGVEDQFHGTGPEESADAASLFTWGAVVLVNGVYIWRGARRRGLDDRFGRVLIIVGYVVLGVAMSSSIHISVELWTTTTSEASNDVLNRTMLTFLGWGVLAAAIVWLGTKIAHEKILMTTEVHTRSG